MACLLLRSIVAQGCGLLTGNVAGSLFWLASPFIVDISFHDPGFYGDGLALGLAATLLAQNSSHPRGRMAAMGLCLGLGFWTTPLTLAFSVPAALWLCLRIQQVKALLCGVAGVVVGAAPWLWANTHTGFASLQRQPAIEGTEASRYLHSFTRLLPAVAGSASGSTQARTIALLCSITILAGLAVALWERNAAITMLCVSALLIPAVVAASNVPVVPGAGRYASLMVPAVVAVLAWAVSRRRAVAAAVVI